MKSTIYNILQRQSLRLSLCALALTCCTMGFAQDEATDDIEEESTESQKTPQRKVVDDNTPTYNVQGTVYDQATNSPIAGVRLQVLGDNRFAAMTDAEGKFTIKVPTYTTALYVQGVRYLAQQVAINPYDESQKIVIKMLSNKFAPMYDDYNTITSQNGFTSNGGNTVIDNEISTKLGADMRSVLRSGTEQQGAFMLIRGINSINANSQPLVILDGVELDMQYNRSRLHLGDYFNLLSAISPEDIDKVTVLKNATALYGARGANGVILIETKRGHSMATRIDFKASAGIALKPSTPTMMDASQYRNYAVETLGTVPDLISQQNETGELMNFYFLNDDPTGYFYNMYHNNTNWKDEIYRTAITQNYSINVQGGDDVGMYNLSVGYMMADSNVKLSDFDRINVRFNTDISLLSNLTTKFDVSFSRTNQYLYDDGFAEDMSLSTITSPTILALIKSPLVHPYQYNNNVKGFTSLYSEADDLFASLGSDYSLANPVALINAAEGERKNKNENTFFNIAIAPTWQINKNLSATTHFSYYLNRNSQAYYRPNKGVPAFKVEGLGTVYSKVASVFAKETNIISNTHIDWSKKFGANDLAITGGFRYTYFSYDDSDLSTQYDDVLPDDKNPSLDPSKYSAIDGANDVWKNMQWYASADYNYNNRFLATVSLLLESNSRFGANVSSSASIKMGGVRWAIFPSVQLGWIMSNEAWFPKNSTVNFLKVYGGFDVSGNDDISNYAARTSYTMVRYNDSEVGGQLTNVGNDLIKWETTHKWNFGFKANMFNNRVSVGADFYYHKVSDLLALKSFENPVGGINNYWTNDGSLENKGLELSLSGKAIETKDLHLELGATLGHYVNKVRSLTDGDYTSSVYGDKNILTSEGNPVGLFYGYQTAPYVFATEAEASTAHNGTDYLKYVDETGADQTFNAGDVHFIDQNGDGYIDENDKVVLGDPNPDIYGNIFATLNWKRFTLNMGFSYCVGNDVYNYQRSFLNSGAVLYNQQVAEVGHWRYEGQQTNLPRVAYGDPKGNNRFSDRWIEDGSFLRLKNVTLTYDIPVPESWQSWLQGLSVWGEAKNVFTITRYTGNDPEFSVNNSVLYQGVDCGNIAQSRAFVLGVKINL